MDTPVKVQDPKSNEKIEISAAILRYLEGNPRATCDQIADALHASNLGVFMKLRSLASTGFIVSAHGKGNNTVYSLKER